MNDHYASTVHRDKTAQFHAEARGSRLVKSARDDGAAPRGWFTRSRKRLAALAAAVLPTPGR
jgi:hypothetical protein